jgi:hypothetical protein
VQRIVIPCCNNDHARSWRELVQNGLNFESIGWDRRGRFAVGKR